MRQRTHPMNLVISLAAASLLWGPPLTAYAQPDAKKSDASNGYRTGTGLLNKGMHELAAKEFRDFLREHADDAKAPNARYALAVCLVPLGKHTEATKELEQVVALKGFEFAADAMFLRAQCAESAGDDAEAATWYGRVVTEHVDYVHADAAAASQGELLYRLGKTAEARASLAGMLKRSPQSASRPRAALLLALCDLADGKDAEVADAFTKLRADKACAEFVSQATLLEAQCRHRLGQSDRALPLYKLAAGSGDREIVPEALLGTAQLRRQAGDLLGAAAAVTELTSRFSDSPMAAPARFEQSRILLDSGEPQKAAELLAALSRDTPTLLPDEVMYWLAKCESRLKKYDAAAAQLALAMKEFPKSRLRVEMQYDRAASLAKSDKAQDAIAQLETLVTESPKHDLAPEALVLTASLLHGQANYDKCESSCRSFLTAHANHARAPAIRFLLADSEYVSGKFEAAERTCSELVTLHPKDAKVQLATLRRGLCLARLGRFSDAEPILMAAVANVAPSTPDVEASLVRPALAALGDGCFAASRWKDAEKWFTRLVAGEPEENGDVPLLKLGLSMHRTGRPAEALTIYDRLVAQYPKSELLIQSQFERGQALYELAKPGEAAVVFQRVLDAEQQLPMPRFSAHAARYLASIATANGKPDEAAALLSRAAELAADGSTEAGDLKFDQALSLMAANKFAEAQTVLEDIARHHADHAKHAEAAARQAMCLVRQGKYVEAVAQIRALGQGRGSLSSSVQMSLAYEEAWSLKALKRNDEAAKVYAELLAGKPTPDLVIHASLDLAQLYVAAGGFADALKLLETSTAVPTPTTKPDTASTNTPQAATHTANVQEQSVYLKAVCEHQLGKHSQAARTLGDFGTRFGGSELTSAAALLRGEALLKVGNAADALIDLRVAARSDSPDMQAPALLRLGEAAAAVQRWTESEEALASYLKKFEREELWFQARFGIGWAQENQGRFDAAIKSYTTVAERHNGPTAARAQFQIGECLFAQKKYDDAVRELLKTDILHAYPEWSAAALYEAGRCLGESGKQSEARRQYEDVLKRWPESPWAKLSKEQLDKAPAAASALPGRSRLPVGR